MKIPLWLTVGILAGLWMPVAGALGVAPWPLFVAWAVYFVTGAELTAFKKIYPSLLLGVASGYLTIFLGAQQLSTILGSVGVPLFVGLFAATMVILGNFEIFALTPAAFFAFATYFGTGLNLKTTLIGLILGPIIGYLSIKATTAFDFNPKKTSSL